jgi:hypothetical protein
VVALDHIRVRGRRTLGLTAAPLTTKMLRRIPGPVRTIRSLSSLSVLLRRILVRNTGLLSRELSTTRLLLRHRAIVHTALLSLRASVADDIVCSALTATLLVGHRAVTVVAVIWIGVLQDDVPGVEKAGEEAEAAERDVDE